MDRNTFYTNRCGITYFFGSKQWNKDISYVVLLHGFGTTNSWAARIKVWGNCDKQMSPAKLSRESRSLGIFFFSFTTEIKMLWSFWLFEAAPVNSEAVQPSKFLFVNLRKATVHQFVCVFNSLILPDTFCCCWLSGIPSNAFSEFRPWSNRSSVTQQKVVLYFRIHVCFLAANKGADRWQILDGIWTKLPVDWQSLYVYFWWNDLSMCKGFRCFLIKLYFHMRNVQFRGIRWNFKKKGVPLKHKAVIKFTLSWFGFFLIFGRVDGPDEPWKKRNYSSGFDLQVRFLPLSKR